MASGRRVDRAGDIPRQNNLLAHVGRVGNRHGGQKRLGVWVQRVVVKLTGLGRLDDFAEIHHRHAVGDVLDDTQVVGDKKVGQFEPSLEILEQVDDLCLDRHVQGRDRLVAHDELGLERQRPRDTDALALPAGELVRVARGVKGLHSHGLEQVGHPLLELLALGNPVNEQRFADDGADRHAWVERGVGVLEDDLHVAPQGPQRTAGDSGDVFPLEQDIAGRRLQQFHDEPPGRCLSAARLAHKPQDLPLSNLETDPVNRLHVTGNSRQDAAADREVLHQVFDFNQRFHSFPRNPWCMRFPAS